MQHIQTHNKIKEDNNLRESIVDSKKLEGWELYKFSIIYESLPNIN